MRKLFISYKEFKDMGENEYLKKLKRTFIKGELENINIGQNKKGYTYWINK